MRLRWYDYVPALIAAPVILLLIILLTGCESARVLGGNENSVVVDPGMSAADGFTAAEQHCAKYGKRPRLVQRGAASRYVFDCI